MTISGFKRSQTFMALNTYFQLSKSEGCFLVFLVPISLYLEVLNICLDRYLETLVLCVYTNIDPISELTRIIGFSR